VRQLLRKRTHARIDACAIIIRDFTESLNQDNLVRFTLAFRTPASQDERIPIEKSMPPSSTEPSVMGYFV
jgi:hypothetical protein